MRFALSVKPAERSQNVSSPEWASEGRVINSNLLPRAHLIERIDTEDEVNLVWVSGRAGAGKTSVVTTWLEQYPKRPQGWLRLNREDEDPYWLLPRIAAAMLPENCVLSILPVESDILSVSRRFLMELAQNLPGQAVLVLDDYERLAADSDIQRVLVALAECWPVDGKLIFVSREEPPAMFARIRASRGFVAIRDSDLRLNDIEARDIGQKFLPDENSEAQLDTIVAAASGWVAGLVLLTRGAATAPVDLHTSVENQGVFDYFAEEIWHDFDTETRHTLEIVSILPFVTDDLAARLVGCDNATGPLRRLAQLGFFVSNETLQDGVTTQFQLHPLFRAFLMQRLKCRLGIGTVRSMQANAAACLEQRGKANDALALYLEADCTIGAVSVVERFAPAQYKAHRFRTLLRWLDSLPDKEIEASGRLLLWRGAALALFDPLLSRTFLLKAWSLLVALDDTELCTLCCGIAIDTYMLMWDDFHGIDPWLERLLEIDRSSDMAAVDDRLTSSMVGALFFRRTGDRRIGHWLDRATATLNRRVEAHIIPMLAQWTFMATIWTRDLPSARVLLETIRRQVIVNGKIDPYVGVWLHNIEALYHWNAGELDTALEVANSGLECAHTIGIHVNDVLLHFSGGIASLMAGRIEAAQAHSVAAMAKTQTEALMNVVSHHQLAGMVAWHNRQHALSRSHLVQGAERAKSAGLIFAEAFLYCGVAFMECEIGEKKAGRSALDKATSLIAGMSIPLIDVDIAILKAWLVVGNKYDELRIAALHEAFMIAKRNDRVASCWWRPTLMSSLCASALAENIEPTHVNRIILVNRLSPPDWFCSDERWPWPVRVRLCGQLSIEINGSPLEFSNRVPARVLDLLTALIAREKRPGAGVNVDQLVDDLWPELEGDRGKNVFKTTLARLRRLLGIEGLIVISNGRLATDPQRCWSDVGAIVTLNEQIITSSPEDNQQIVSDKALHGWISGKAGWARQTKSTSIAPDRRDLAILAYYRGPLLETLDEFWIESLRRRIRRSVVVASTRAKKAYVTLDSKEQAAALHNSLIKIDPAIESLLNL